MITLERICKTVGYPKTIRVDQGAYQKGVVLDFLRSGKPTDAPRTCHKQSRYLLAVP